MGVFSQVRANRPGRSAFNLSHDRKLTCDMGQLIPVLLLEALPGDHFTIGIEAVVRFLPQVAPLLHQVDFYCHYFFVPNRLTWPGDETTASWQKFITGGFDGADASTIPTWTPTGGNVTNDDGTVLHDNAVGSLWDYLGFPTDVVPTGFVPVDFPRRGYNLIWNQYYKDETQDADVALTSSIVLNRRWEKDFLTSALPWQQRGTAGALPVTIGGSSSAAWAAGSFDTANPTSVAWKSSDTASDPILHVGAGTANELANAKAFFAANTVVGSSFSAASFNVSDLRLAFQTQKWQERNARGGARYIEELLGHFGHAPKDMRLQRAEYIGGCRMPVVMSEVLQTNATPKDGAQAWTTAQGTMAGHGLVAGRDVCASYKCDEHGVIFGIMSVMPRTAYNQGIARNWIKATKLDYYWPEFAHLSEQAVMRGEVYADGVSGDNNTVFGYQARFNELRYEPSRVHGLMRQYTGAGAAVTGSLSYWHLGRGFTSAPGLNATFLKCVPRKDFLAAPTQPAMVVNIGNIVKAVRPLPIESQPGLVDHE